MVTDRRTSWPQPVTLVLGVALVETFLALAFASEARIGLSQVLYGSSAVGLAFVGAETWRLMPSPNRIAVVGVLLGLAATEVYALTELGAVDPDEWQGIGALIVPAWLFAASGWYANLRGVRTLRWVIPLLQCSFVALSAVAFVFLLSQESSTAAQIGYGTAAAIAVASFAATTTGIVGRVRLELRRRAGRA